MNVRILSLNHPARWMWQVASFIVMFQSLPPFSSPTDSGLGSVTCFDPYNDWEPRPDSKVTSLPVGAVRSGRVYIGSGAGWALEVGVPDSWKAAMVVDSRTEGRLCPRASVALTPRGFGPSPQGLCGWFYTF